MITLLAGMIVAILAFGARPYHINKENFIIENFQFSSIKISIQ